MKNQLSEKGRFFLGAKKSAVLFALCFFAYSFAYIARVNYNIALIELKDIYGSDTVGIIGSVYFLCYALGQFINGVIADKKSPYIYLLIGILISVTCNILMSFVKQIYVLAAVWGINGFAQSMLWAPILIIISRVITPTIKEKALLLISFAGPVGTVACYLVCGALINFGYRYVFLFSGIVFFAVFAVIGIFCFVNRKQLSAQRASDISSSKNSEISPTEQDSDNVSSVKTSEIIPATKNSAKSTTAISPLSILCLLALSVIIQGVLKDGLSSWIPTVISGKFSIDAASSSFMSLALPIVSLCGSWAVTAIYIKLGKKVEFLICSVCMFISAVTFAVLIVFGESLFMFVAVLSLEMTIMCAFNQVSIAFIPQRFLSCGKIAAVSGTLNALTYLGSAISSYFIGYISEKLGFSAVIIGLCALSAIAGCACLISHFKEKNRNMASADIQ